jgi:hypothetical protein
LNRLYRTVKQVFLSSIVCACLNAADSLPSVTAPAAIEEETLPILSERAISPEMLDAQLSAVRRIQVLASQGGAAS